MENLIIDKTENSPEIVFNTNGKLKIEGKFITENAVITFETISKWINNYTGDNIEFDINLEYMNTSASMQLFSFLLFMDESDTIKKILVNWYYNEDDEEHLETGKIFEERLERVNWNYIKLLVE